MCDKTGLFPICSQLVKVAEADKDVFVKGTADAAGVGRSVRIENDKLAVLVGYLVAASKEQGHGRDGKA